MLRISSKCRKKNQFWSLPRLHFFSWWIMNEHDSFFFTSSLWPVRHFSLPPECCPPQPQSAQVLCARGECEGGSVDSRWGGVPETQVAEDHGVGALPTHRSRSVKGSVETLLNTLCTLLLALHYTLCYELIDSFVVVCFAYFFVCRSPSLVKNLPSSLGYGTALNASLQVWTKTLSWLRVLRDWQTGPLPEWLNDCS